MRSRLASRTDNPGDARAAAAGALMLLIVVVSYVGYSSTRFLAAGRDDVFLMLWAGQTLGSAGWFVNFNYQQQEIASSILGVLIAATTKGLPVTEALLLLKVAGVAAGCGVLALLWLERRLIWSDSPRSAALALCAVTATASSPVFEYWSLGGLETPHHALALLGFCIALTRSLISGESRSLDWPLLATVLLLILVRTEALWPLLGGLCCAVLASRVFAVRPAVAALLLALCAWLGLVTARYLMTGAWWPNPTYAKTGSIASAIPSGVTYVWDYAALSSWTWLQAAAVIYGVARVVGLTRLVAQRKRPESMLVFEGIATAVVAGQIGVVILVGGNWMEYFRFMAPIVPLLNVLVFCMIGRAWMLHRHRWPPRAAAAAISGAVAATALWSTTQAGLEASGGKPGCAGPIERSVWTRGIERIAEQTVVRNCAHSRDWAAVRPFIEGPLDVLVRRSGRRLVVASSQAGLFPYLIRQRYPPERLWFIDTLGLNDLAIARLPGTKTSVGYHDGQRIDLALLGKAGSLSVYLRQHPPDLVYLTEPGPEERENFAGMGYAVIWDTVGAVVFYRPAST